MTPEAPRGPLPEQEPVDPIAQARFEVNEVLFTVQEFNGPTFVSRITRLENTLLGSKDKTPEAVFSELQRYAEQGVIRSQQIGDELSVTTLQDKHEGYKLALERFTERETAQPVAPTKTERIPMSTAKGPQVPERSQVSMKSPEQTRPREAKEASVGALVRALRTKAGMTQSAVARTVGEKNSGTISQFETGKINYSESKLNVMLDALGATDEERDVILTAHRAQSGRNSRS